MTKDTQIRQFRHFNRFYTDYLGLLDQSLYDAPVNLTEARILYELDARPDSSARELMRRLGLDKGYLSRLLKQFKNHKWIDESPSTHDARMKMLRLTDNGNSLMKKLHTAASAQAEKALAHLSSGDRQKLLSAMSTIENILSEKNENSSKNGSRPSK